MFVVKQPHCHPRERLSKLETRNTPDETNTTPEESVETVTPDPRICNDLRLPHRF
jgi:hypothetical protein